MTYQREFEQRLNIGLVGVGSHAYRNLLPALHYLPVRLAAICDLNDELARKTAQEYGVERVFTSTAAMYAAGGLDAVLLCVGARHHPALAIEALQAGLHVWMEKPPAMRVSEVEAMRDNAGNRVVMVGFKKAFMPATDKAHELISGGACGPLASLLAEYAAHLPEDGATVLETGKSSDWLSNGVHPLSLLMRVGGPIKAVQVHRNPHGGGIVVLEFVSGATGALHLWAWRGYAPTERYSFVGTSGAVTIDNSDIVSLHRGIPFEYARSSNFAPPGLDSGSVVWQVQNRLATLENKALFVQGIVQELRHFCDCVLNGERPTVGSLDFALHIMQVYEAGLVSNGARVEIPTSR